MGRICRRSEEHPPAPAGEESSDFAQLMSEHGAGQLSQFEVFLCAIAVMIAYYGEWVLQELVRAGVLPH